MLSVKLSCLNIPLTPDSGSGKGQMQKPGETGSPRAFAQAFAAKRLLYCPNVMTPKIPFP